VHPDESEGTMTVLAFLAVLTAPFVAVHLAFGLPLRRRTPPTTKRSNP
jgi:hypothetical protein